MPAGAAVSRPEAAPSNHSAAVFDDVPLAEGTALYAELALRRLGVAGNRSLLGGAQGSGRI